MRDDADDFDDFDDDDGLDFEDTGFDDFGGGGDSSSKNLVDLWNSNPLFKVGSVLAGIVMIVAVVALLGGDNEDVAQSRVNAAPETQGTASTEGSSQAYIDAVIDQNEQRLEEATSSGGSAIPTPIDVDEGVFSIIEDATKGAQDPLQRWKSLKRSRGYGGGQDCNCDGDDIQKMAGRGYGVGAGNRPIIGYDKDGNPIYGYDKNGKPIIATMKTVARSLAMMKRVTPSMGMDLIL